MRNLNRSRSKKELSALHANFLRKTHDYQWDNWEETKLAQTLQECIQCEERIAEAYSVVKEIIRRKTGLTLFDSQLLAAYSMQQGRIAELPTGEGKTLAAVVTATILALQKRTVHILVFNDYLAYRDYSDNLPIYMACGLSCGYIKEISDFAHRKAAYACDVVYVSAKEAGFDYLRDFLCMEKERLLFKSFWVALVDEADSILIDEARIPLVLAGNSDIHPPMVAQIFKAVSELSEKDVGISREENQAWLTNAGFDTMEEKMQIKGLHREENFDVLALAKFALQARFLLEKDKDYIVQDGAILVIDESTGRIAQNRRFPDALHQAVEMRELGVHDATSTIYNSMSMQAFLLQYEMLCGMTATAASSAAELYNMYELEVDVIPPHTPCIRIDHPDAIFFDKKEQEIALLSQIKTAHAKGQPILIGTQSVQESERFSMLLVEHGLEHCVLNAKNNAEEAAIIAEAGRPYQVTISTNMAGRGVDIKLGGSDERQTAFVRDVGGLFVISTGINRSLRIDNQLRGRAGRQGDPGESQFFVCLKDLTLETFFEIESYQYKKYPKLLRHAQKVQEGRDAEARYILERYSRILEEQRQRVTDHRLQILLGSKAPEILSEEEPGLYQALVDRVGRHGVMAAEKQLSLYFINVNWASYLAAMEDKRTGIHLMIIGGKSPLDEYCLFAISAFDEMSADIRRDVVEYMQKCKITENGINMEDAGLSGATTTWTYMINESADQFSILPHLIKSTIKGTGFTLRGLYDWLKKMLWGKRD